MKSKKSAPAVVENLLRFLQDNHLTPMLPMIIESLERKKVELDKLETASITLSHELKPSAMKDIEKIIMKKPEDKVVVTYDNSLIGGYLIRYRGREYDGSVRGQLRELKTILMK
jgi:F0F1-type ATP synthase delta subunit